MVSRQLLKILCCPFCRGTLDQKKSKNLRCSSCSRTFGVKDDIPFLTTGEKSIDVIISEDRWNYFYKRELIESDKTLDSQMLSHLKFINRFKKNIKKGIYLDLGCGISWTGRELSRNGITVLCLDISSEAVQKSKMLFDMEKLSGHFVQADFVNIPIKAESIQFIYWGLALEYVEDTKKAIDEAYRILKPQGKIIAAFPVISLGNLTYQQLRGDIPILPVIGQVIKFVHLKILKGKFLRYGYGQSFTTGHIKNLFEKAGFENIKIGYFDTYYPIKFVPAFLRPTFRSILKFRPFWPFAYIEAEKRHEK